MTDEQVVEAFFLYHCTLIMPMPVDLNLDTSRFHLILFETIYFFHEKVSTDNNKN
jgi:hypothetical protein